MKHKKTHLAVMMGKLCYVLLISFFLVLSACAVSGKAVKITDSGNSGPDVLEKMERAKVEEIKEHQEESGTIKTGLSKVIGATLHFTVSEYFSRYSETGDNEGSEYRVGGYDVLSIKVYEEEDLSREAVRVSADGYISLPLLRRLKAAGLTPSEIEDLISLRLAREEYLLDAHVSVLVTGYNSKQYLILGAVEKPGVYPLQANVRVLEAVSRAGGIRTDEAGNKAMILRTEKQSGPQESKIVIEIDLQGLLKGKNQASNIWLRDQDTLFIPQAEHFFIIGKVKNPGSYPFNSDEITLVEAISMAGGFTPVAARNRTRIIRLEGGVEKTIEVNVGAIINAGEKIKDIPILPNDLIVVPESFF